MHDMHARDHALLDMDNKSTGLNELAGMAFSHVHCSMKRRRLCSRPIVIGGIGSPISAATECLRQCTKSCVLR